MLNFSSGEGLNNSPFYFGKKKWIQLLFISSLYLLISACHYSDPPKFYATAIVNDKGVTQIWSKTDAFQLQWIVAKFTPTSDDYVAVTTRYDYLEGQLNHLTRYINNTHSDYQQLHLDNQGNIIFNQWHLSDRNKMITPKGIDNLLLHAKQIEWINKDAIKLGIRLKQGYATESYIIDCQSNRVKNIPISNEQRHKLSLLTHKNVAWLEYQRKKTLILISSEDLCQQAAQILK